jgi:transcriptional regulator with XRE-family HTH domain
MGVVKKRRVTDRSFSGPMNDRVRHARRVAELSQSRLAEQLGVGPSAVAQWEVPNGTSPTVAHLSHIAQITKVSFEWLATGRGAIRLDGDGTPAVDVSAFAHDMLEERLLIAFRLLSPKRREALVRCIEELS